MNVYIGLGIQTGRNLALLQADCSIYMKQMQEFERVKIAKFTQMYQLVISNLTGHLEPSQLEASELVVGLDEQFYNDDTLMVDLVKEFQNRLYAIFGLHAMGADLSLARGDVFIQGAPGVYHHIPDAFHRGLSAFAMARDTNKRKYKRHAQKQRSRIKLWTRTGCINTIHYQHLLDAENAALKNRKEKAKGFYQKAAVTAQRAGFVHDAALASERYAEFLLHDMKDMRSAVDELEKSRKYYSEWGATRKVKMLQEKYTDLFSGSGSRSR